MPDVEALNVMYSETPAEDMAYRFEDNAAWSLARKRLQSRFANAHNPSVLDVGCHTGAFLAGLPNSWRKYGVESAREPVRMAREHGVAIIGERLDTINEKYKHQFDAVTMFDVVEHLLDPATGIGQAAGFLRPDGVLILSTGDFDAWTWRWLGNNHWYLQTPQHLSIISRRFLEHVAERQGLKLRGTRRIPHHYAPLGERCRQAIKATYWGLRRRRGAYRIPHRLLQSLPGLRDLRHMQSVPWTVSIADHIWATYEH